MESAQLPPNVRKVGDNLWNIRGSFKIKGLVDIGTQASLVRRANGQHVLLGGCQFSPTVQRWLGEETDGGDSLTAVIHLHPFHTLSVRAVHDLYPRAKLYGTERHLKRLSDLPWEEIRSEQPELHRAFADDFDFTVPRGVDFIPANPNLHFSSVLALHRESKTLIVDDTLVYVRLPKLFRAMKKDVVMLHPTLAKVLQPRPGAVAEFRAWARELVDKSRDIENLCAAHSAVLLAEHNRGPAICRRIQTALEKAEAKLSAHERKYG